MSVAGFEPEILQMSSCRPTPHTALSLGSVE